MLIAFQLEDDIKQVEQSKSGKDKEKESLQEQVNKLMEGKIFFLFFKGIFEKIWKPLEMCILFDVSFVHLEITKNILEITKNISSI